jgi:predicted nucleic acid-binding protein
LISYADTSFLVALYLPDSNSPSAMTELSKKPQRLAVTPFSIFEFTNAVCARRFRGDISNQDTNRVLELFRNNLFSGAFGQHGLPGGIWDRAAELAEAHTSRLGCRTLDVLHVAIAMELGANTFYTFDIRQKALAHVVRMKVRPAAR